MKRRGHQTEGQGNWRDAIAHGIVVFLLTATLLGVAGRLCLVDEVEGASSASNLFGVVVLLVALALGGREVLRRRP